MLNDYILRLQRKRLGREIDLAFVLDKTLFLFECKSFKSTYTREHAKTNKKIKEAIKQLNKNADYFEENISITLKQLGLSEEISIEKSSGYYYLYYSW